MTHIHLYIDGRQVQQIVEKHLDLRARPITDEHRANLKAAWTDERKKKRSEAQRGRVRGPYRKDP